VSRRRVSPLLVCVLLGCSGGAPAASGQTAADSAAAVLPPPPTASVDDGRRTAITRAVQLVAPAVVTVQTEMVERVPVDPFEAFFGQRSGSRVIPGLGSGFIIRDDGMILTNAHVVSGAQRVSIAMRDATTYPAAIVGVDEANDLAVLKIEAASLPTVRLGTSASLLVGEWAIAIGNPFGFLLGNSEPSVTAGVISATGRNLVTGGEGGATIDMIQTDAAINPGNSGGPLVNAAGEVIGVNSSIFSPSGGSIGLGFAIPIDRARHVAEDLIRYGEPRRAWIGIQLRPAATPNPRDVLRQGAVIGTVVRGSPAAAAGLRPGDVIERANGRAVRNPYDWQAVLLDTRVGARLPLVVRRGGRQVETSVVVADLPEVGAPKVEVLRELQLVTLTPAIRAERGVRTSSGALVFGVTERMSQELGLLQGDVIVQVNRTSVNSAEEVQRAIDYYAGRGPIRLYFERGGRVYFTDFVIQ
jgi:Do/DeqQ family serine protease